MSITTKSGGDKPGPRTMKAALRLKFPKYTFAKDLGKRKEGEVVRMHPSTAAALIKKGYIVDASAKVDDEEYDD